MKQKKEAGVWRNRILRTEEVDPATLTGNPKNWRTHHDHQRKAMTAALREVGWVAPVIVNERTGHLIDGHMRIEEAVRRGERTVPVSFVDLSEEEENEVLATFDPLGSLAVTNTAALASLASLVKTADRDLDELIHGLPQPSDVEPLDPQPFPKMMWYLVGCPFDQAAKVGPHIDELLHVPGVIIESTVAE